MRCTTPSWQSSSVCHKTENGCERFDILKLEDTLGETTGSDMVPRGRFFVCVYRCPCFCRTCFVHLLATAERDDSKSFWAPRSIFFKQSFASRSVPFQKGKPTNHIVELDAKTTQASIFANFSCRLQPCGFGWFFGPTVPMLGAIKEETHEHQLLFCRPLPFWPTRFEESPCSQRCFRAVAVGLGG